MKMSVAVGKTNTKFQSILVTTFDQLQSVILNNTYSLAQFKDQYKKSENFIYAEAVGLDFDGGLTLKEAKLKF